ncbi:MAG: hypothetical protein EXS02_06710 [Planctomycetes bacterium]|nr:hypothetical protein [Planctomycetota bacterium]
MLCVLAGVVTAQQVRIDAPVGGAFIAPEKFVLELDAGVAVQMFESPNLDRYLRRAKECLAREDFVQAIKILQDVVEGRTLVAGDQGDSGAAATDSKQVGLKPEAGLKQDGPQQIAKAKEHVPALDASEKEPPIADPINSVFTEGGRLYRPVRRICQELIVALPPSALALYRTQFEAPAQTALELAERAGSEDDYQAVINRWFGTLAAGAAMRVLADRYMLQGRYRHAIAMLRDLSGVYPIANQQELGISQAWCRFKIALCLRLAEELSAASDEAKAIAAAFPLESLRMMGVLQPLRDLPTSAMFALVDGLIVHRAGAHPETASAYLKPGADRLIPLWQMRWKNNPYAPPPPNKDNERVFFSMGGMGGSSAPPASQYGTGTSMAFFGPESLPDRAVFLEGNRMRVVDAFTGLLLAEGDKDANSPLPQAGKARPRVPVYDFSLQRPVEDESRYFVVAGYQKSDQSVEPLKSNEVIAYDKKLGARLWSTADYMDGSDGFKDVTFLAAPIVYGERLLSPVLRSGAYSLQCFDRSTGKPLYRTRVHSGGTPFYKAPGTRIQRIGGIAFMLTNAGVIAAIDIASGELRWLYRYERSHPQRAAQKAKKPSGGDASGFGQTMFSEQELASFLPSDLFVAGDALIFAPCDGHVLMSLDSATGAPVWMVEAESPFAPIGRIRSLVGANSTNIFALADRNLVCIGLKSGLLRWARQLPEPSAQLTRWRGRGVVLEDQVLVPGDREILVIDADNRSLQIVPLPTFDLGSEPLHGPNNLFVRGPWLGVSYPQGIEVYSLADALQKVAAGLKDPLRKASLLLQSGDPVAATELLISWLSTAEPDDAQRERGTQQLIALALEQASRSTGDGKSALDRVAPLAKSRQSRMYWLLAHLELLRNANNLTAYEQEQDRLYRFMESKN